MIVRFLSILLAIWLGSASVWGQRLYRADRAVQRKAYVDAVQWYEEAFQRNPDLRKSWKHAYQLAQSYAALHDYEQSYRVCKFILSQPESENAVPWHQQTWQLSCQMLASLGRYAEAEQNLEAWMAQYGRTPEVEALIAFYKSAPQNKPSDYEVSYLSLNTHQAEFSPSFFRNGLVFVSNRAESSWITRIFDRTKAQFMDLYRTNQLPAESGRIGQTPSTSAAVSSSGTIKSANVKSKSTLWGITPDSPIYSFRQYREYSSQPVIKINQSIQTKLHEGPATFYHSQPKVIFTGNERRSGRISLYTSKIQGEKWVDTQSWPFRDASYGHPALRKDEQILYYTSDRAGGAGGTDLYMSRWKNNQWSEPINLGAFVNTPGDEMFPFVDSQGILYFASNMHPGLGGLDIFAVQTNDVGFPLHPPVHLGNGINSPADDFGITIQDNGTFGYFSSNRKRGGDDDDIYSFRRDEPLILQETRTLQVIDSVSHREISLVDWTLAQGGASGQTDSTGLIQITRLGIEKPFITWKKEGFFEKTIPWPEKVESEVLLVKKPEPAPVLISPSPEVKVKDELIVATKPKEVVLTPKKLSKKTGNRVQNQPFNFNPKDISDAFLLKSIPMSQPEELQAGLNEVSRVLKENSDLFVEILAHSDSRGKSKTLLEKTQALANQTAIFLIQNDISSRRIRAIGKGGGTPLNECAPGVLCTEEEYERNRRIEFWIYRLIP